MDNITHSLFGAVLARAGLAQRHGRGTTALLVVASNLPDLDAVLMLTHGEQSAWLRRTHSHCLLGGAVMALALGAAWSAATRGRLRPVVGMGLALLGVLGHVALDLLNSYGVVLLWPFSSERFELAWVFIIDLAMAGLLAAPLLLRRVLARRWPEAVVHRAALACVVAYVALCAGARARANVLLHGMLARDGARPQFTYVFPEALGPHRWKAVALEDARWRLWLVHVLDGRCELVHEAATAAADPRVVAARATPRGRDVERFFKAPVWTLDASGARATCTDLRFFSAIISRRTGPFAYEFPLTPREPPARTP